MIIGIIPAKSISKRIANKNFITFNGKPMIAWSIEAAIKSKMFEKVLVSTDDNKIADISREYSAEVPFLRTEAFDDFSSSSAATYAALCQAEKYWNEKYETVAQLMANCPLRTEDDIRKSILAFDDSEAPAQLSCTSFGWMNPLWAVKLDEHGIPTQLFPDENKLRSQDLPDLYCPTGALWLAKRNDFIISKNFYLSGHRFYPMDWISALDIDDEDDLLMAKACLAIRNFKKK